MASRSKVLTTQQLVQVLADYQQNIVRTLRQLVEEASKGTAETGWHKVVRELFDDGNLGWMAEDYQDLVVPSKHPDMPKGDALLHLQKCQKQALDLSSTLNLLRGTGWRELRAAYERESGRQSKVSLIDLDGVLLNLHVAASQAEEAVKALPTRKGQTPDSRPLEIAKVAARHFHRITGEDPGRIVEVGDKPRGWFPSFLTGVFAAIGIKASVDHHAKQAAHWWKTERDDLDLLRGETTKPSKDR